MDRQNDELNSASDAERLSPASPVPAGSRDAAPGAEVSTRAPLVRYAVLRGSTVWNRPDRQGGTSPIQLANFAACIVEHVVVDDGHETTALYKLEATVEGKTTTLTIPTRQFASLTWVEEKLGARAIIEPGIQMRDHLRAAIQYLSEKVVSTTVYKHVGWREIEGEFVYLSGDGAIGERGVVSSVAVEPPDSLRAVALPCPDDITQQRNAVRASLALRRLGPGRIAYPLLASIWRSLIGDTDFSIALTGKTGEFKTAVAVVMQQHFGAGFSSRRLPANWEGTANAIEETLFLAKDMVAVVDDYAPQATAEAARTLQSSASRIFRSVGNGQGRRRMRADTSLRAARPPRSLPMSTGEDVPPGESVRARVLIIDVERGAIDRDVLTDAQRGADAGVYAVATGTFVRWLAPRIRELKRTWAVRIEALAEALPAVEGHRRASRMASELVGGLRVFLDFAQELGAVTSEESVEYAAEADKAILEAAQRQGEYRQTADPAEGFIAALGAAMACGMAHVDPFDGTELESAPAFGWQLTNVGFRASGQHIGWISPDGIYIEPLAAMSVVRRLDPSAASLSIETLCKRLWEAGQLASTDTRGGRTRFKVRKTIGGVRRDVLHLRTESVIGERVADGLSDRGQQATADADARPATPPVVPNVPPTSQTQQGEVQ